MGTVTVTAADGGSFDAWLALPPGGAGPGLVLLQEIFGVNAAMRERAAWFAGCGFVVIVPDLYWRQQRGVELSDRTDAEWERAVALFEGLDEALAVRDAAAALTQLRTLPGCTGAAGAAGWCLGGTLAFLLAARGSAAPTPTPAAASAATTLPAPAAGATPRAVAADAASELADGGRPDASVGYYGVGLELALAEAPQIVTPLLLHLAGADDYCRPPVQARLHAALDRHPQLTLRDYPGRGHGFARPGGRNFDATAAELADLRTAVFLLRHLHAAGARGAA